MKPIERGSVEALLGLRRWRWYRRVVPFFIGLAAISAVARADIRITLLSDGAHPLDQTTDVQLIRFGTAEAEARVWQGMPLFAYDEIRCPKGQVRAEISTSASILRLSGPFRVVVWGEQNGVLSAEVYSGRMDVQAGEPTSLKAGPVTLGSSSTVYGFSISSAQGDAQKVCVVYEGEVRFQAGAESTLVQAGQSIAVPPSGDWMVSAVGDSEVRVTAQRFASMDAAKAISAGIKTGAADRDTLEARYTAALRSPDDVAAQANLGITQVALRLPTQALYQLKRADVNVVDTAVVQRAEIAAARSEAYIQLGRRDDAVAVLDSAQLALPNTSVPKELAGGRELTIKFRDPGEIPDSQKYLFDLVEQRQYREASVGFDGRIRSGKADSRDYYGLALSQSRLGQERPASINASLALKFAAQDSLLSDEELGRAQQMEKPLRMVLPNHYQQIAK
jgi:tetratricopeptide (TPR) repeat protein